MAVVAIGATCVVFAGGVLGGWFGGASWRWSSVVVITEMAIFGSSLGLFITISKHIPVEILLAQRVSAFLVGTTSGVLIGYFNCSTYFADRFVRKERPEGVPEACIAAYSLLAFMIYRDIVQGRNFF